MYTLKKAVQTLTLVFLTLLTLSSCSSEEEPLKIAEERTDISITGDMDLDVFRQSIAGENSVDLIAYNFYGMNADRIDFIIDLDGDHALIIELVDAQHGHPWMQVDLPYHIYPGQDLEDKLYYTRIKFRDSEGQISYSTNGDANIPQSAILDAFRIIRYDGGQIHCRMRDMQLHKTSFPEKVIQVNGTFVGVIDFE